MLGKVNISRGGQDTSDATAGSADILSGKTAYVAGEKLTGTMANQGSKTFTPSSSNQTSPAGYYSSVTVNPKTTVNINELIESYTVASGGNVTAGGFVKYISNWNLGNDTQISTISNSTAGMSAVKLSNNKVFIAYGIYSYKLYGVVCTITGTTISKGTETQLSTATYSESNFTAVALSDSKVFICFNNNYNLCAMVCTISETVITQGNTVSLNDANTSYYDKYVVVSSENIVFVYNNYSTISYRICCSISGTTISVGTKTNLGSILVYGATTLPNSKICVLNQTGYATIFSVSGTSLTSEAYGTVCSNASSMSIIGLPSGKILSVYIKSINSTYYLYGKICTISGTSILEGTETQLKTFSQASSGIIPIAILSSDKVFITYSTYGLVCTVNDTTIAVDENFSLIEDGSLKTAVALTENKVFTAHSSSSNFMKGIIIQRQINIDKIQSSSDEIFRHSKNICNRRKHGTNLCAKCIKKGGNKNVCFYR